MERQVHANLISNRLDASMRLKSRIDYFFFVPEYIGNKEKFSGMNRAAE
jgi:hypothetical protein